MQEDVSCCVVSCPTDGMVWYRWYGMNTGQHMVAAPINTIQNTTQSTQQNGWMDAIDGWMDGCEKAGRQAGSQQWKQWKQTNKIKNSSPQSSEHTQITMGSRTVPSNKQQHQHQHQHQHQQAKATSRLGIKNNHSTGLLNKITK
jgi:hypothetical protein